MRVQRVQHLPGPRHEDGAAGRHAAHGHHAEVQVAHEPAQKTRQARLDAAVAHHEQEGPQRGRRQEADAARRQGPARDRRHERRGHQEASHAEARDPVGAAGSGHARGQGARQGEEGGQAEGEGVAAEAVEADEAAQGGQQERAGREALVSSGTLVLCA